MRMDQEPEYWDYDDYDPRDDPVVAFQERVERLVAESEELTRLVKSDRFLVYGELPALHLIYTNFGLVLMQFPNTLPRAAE
jgi:hypothetical protein